MTDALGEAFAVKDLPPEVQADVWADIMIRAMQRDRPTMILDIAAGGRDLFVQRARKADTHGFSYDQLKRVYAAFVKAARAMGQRR